MVNFSLHGKVALVTGASRGIGAAIAVELAAAGADVAITARQVESLTQSSEHICSKQRRCLSIELELPKLNSIQAAVDRIEDELGPIDILVNNAGVNIPQPAIEVTEDQWDAIVDTNLKGTFFCAQQVGQRMLRRQQGKIINVSSAAGLIPADERAAYCASKAGVIMLTRQLALEWSPHGVTVNAIAPTFVETELAAQTLNRPGVRDYWVRRIPIGRLATVDDVAAAVLYLASPAGSFLTGTVIPVDGGLTMR